MIRSIKIINTKNSPIKYTKKLNGRVFNFEKGFNVIVGPNGSGKSSLITLLKHIYCCNNSLTTLTTIPNFYTKLSANCFKLDADPTLMFDYNRLNKSDNVGCNSSRTEMLALYENQRLSSGEVKMNNIMFLKNIIENECKKENYIKEVSGLKKHFYFNSEYEPKLHYIVIADEPENSMQFKLQKRFFDDMANEWVSIKEQVQIIIASHSPFILNRDANYIEMEEGFLEQSVKLFKEYFNN